MQGPSTTRLLAIGAIVVGVAVGAVLVLVPSGRTANLTRARQVGPELPRSDPAAPGHAAWVQDENRRLGTSDWHVTGPTNRGNIEGYADATSASRGETVRLYVSTDARSYRVEAYRMGWYGGLQARLVWTSSSLTGERQAPASVDPVTAMAEAPWTPSLSIVIDRAWVPGDYLLKLVADNGYQQFVPLTVRDDASRAALVVVNSVTTWQAYNRWGGHSLYEGVGRTGVSSGTGRAQVVSFDRPYDNDLGTGDFLGNELPMVSLLEKEGYDVTYWTDVDLHYRGNRLGDHRALLSLGHDEYWTREMRDAVEQARDRGLNVAFFGANAVYRVIRLESSDLGQFRQEVNYRVASDDPLRKVDDSRVTVSWREPPVSRPESSLIGSYYECNPAKGDMVVPDPSVWVFAGTDLEPGGHIKGVVGPEYDRYDRLAPQPPGPVQVLAHSPLRCRGKSTYSDMTYYTTPANAGVLATGTIWWISRLGSNCPKSETCPNPQVVRVTINVLDAFSTGPAGLAHPSVANSTTLPSIRPGDTVPTSVDESQSQSQTRNTTSYTSPYSSSTTRPSYTTRTTRRFTTTTR